MVFRNVQRLEVDLEQHLPINLTTPALTRALFSSMYFPEATGLVVNFKGTVYVLDCSSEHQKSNTFYCYQAVSRIFRHVDRFPRVSKLHLKIESAFGESDAHAELSIPLSMLPSLQPLTLESDGPTTIIKEPETPDEIGFDEEFAIPPRVVGKVMPTLETVTLDAEDDSVAAAWLAKYLEYLKDRGG